MSIFVLWASHLLSLRVQMPKKNGSVDAPALTEAHETGTRRLAPEVRERMIVDKAIDHFATHGFSGSTRELARQLGVTQPLLYRYFPSKEALIDRVYEEVYSWDTSWEKLIRDRTVPLQDRLVRFYQAYAHTILRREWIRIFIFAGLTREGINSKYLTRLRERVFNPVMDEIRQAHGLAAPSGTAERAVELELIWSLHASIFYVGVRKWIYGLPVTEDIDSHIEHQIDAFLNGTPAALKKLLVTESAKRPKATKAKATT